MGHEVLSFNPYKHHLQFVRQMIITFNKKGFNQDTVSILNEIKQIGNNIMDLYTGDLQVEEIFNDIINQLALIELANKNDFKKWLGISGYKTFELEDNSFWILRLGAYEAAFVHIHPARYGKHVIRITGSAWKTALAVEIMKNRIPESLTETIERINYVRNHFIDLAPVKKIIQQSNLDVALKLLNVITE